MNKFLLYFFILSTVTPGQIAHHFEVLDNNLFKMENGKTIQLLDIYIPTLKDTNYEVRQLAIEINTWLRDLTERFTFTIIPKGAMKVKIMFDSDRDLFLEYLKNGYGIFVGEKDEEFEIAEKFAQENNKGLWNLNSRLLDNLKLIFLMEPKPKPIDNSQVIVNKPNIALIGLCVASLLLSWDSFASAANIQDVIDSSRKLFNNYDSSELESEKLRKQIVGVGFLVAGIITTIYSFQDLEIKLNYNNFAINYRF